MALQGEDDIYHFLKPPKKKLKTFKTIETLTLVSQRYLFVVFFCKLW